jgi:signal transduction histidine kinase
VSTRVAVLAPTGADGSLAVRVLREHRIEALECRDIEHIAEAIAAGIGAVVLAEEALTPGASTMLEQALSTQPGWSDVPLVILTAEGELTDAISGGLERIVPRANATLLERPVRVATLVTILRAALRARERQFEVRDHLTALDQARAEAEAANRAKVDFLAVMSHELRTPLNAISGYVDLMELGIHGDLTPEQRTDLARIQRSQRHLLGLINGVLNFARIERGMLQYNITKVAAADILSAVEALIAPQAESRGLHLRIVPCDRSVIVFADPDKAQQALLNLAGNAIKFTETGGSVTVTCAPQDDAVAIVVEDTGPGIEAAKLELIFEPFVQVDSRLTRRREGVGLGLAISRDLARGMGGDLTAESEVGRGSRFVLTLRRA